MRIMLFILSFMLLACTGKARHATIAPTSPATLSATLPATAPATQIVRYFGPRPATRLAYVFDVGGLADWEAVSLRDEVKKTIGTLRSSQRAQLIVCADGVQFEFPPGDRLQSMTPETKRDALAWLEIAINRAREKTSGPDATQALTAAARLALSSLAPESKPRAEVVYVLTGRTLAASTAEEISKANPGRKAIVHAIAYLRPDKAGEDVLRRIAADNRGIFKYVKPKDVTE